MVQSTLIKGSAGSIADVVQANGHKGIVAATIPGINYTPLGVSFRDENGSINLNVDASSSGTPDGIHNGTDSVLWTAAAASGVWDFASTAQAQQGTKSIDATATVDGDQALITRSSPIDADSYNSLSGYVYLTAYNETRNEILLSFQLAGAVNGVQVNIADFADPSTLNAWQKFTIPLSSFGVVGNIDEMAIQTVRTAGQPPDYYLDTLQLEEAGSIIYTAEPENGKRYEFQEIDLFLEDALDTTLLNNSMPNWSSDQLLGLSSLSNGITLRFTQTNKVRFSGTFRNLGDVLFAAFSVVDQGCDGTTAYMKLTAKLADFARMEPSDKDKMEILISDDLSGLTRFRANLRGRELM